MKRLSRFPDRPNNAGHFIGDGDGRFVVAYAALELQTPEMQTLGTALASCSDQYGACSMNQQRPQIRIAMLANPAQPSPSTGRCREW